MKPGIYAVTSWNGKDGVLLRADGEFLAVTKTDLPDIFRGTLRVGEKVAIKTIIVMEPLERMMSAKQRNFIDAENARRRIYGAKSL